jgi:hypothetical protein
VRRGNSSVTDRVAQVWKLVVITTGLPGREYSRSGSLYVISTCEICFRLQAIITAYAP